MSDNKKSINAYKILTAPVLAIAGLLTTILPSMAVTDSYSNNDYRFCAAKLLTVGVTPEAASEGCATALRPRELSFCVTTVKNQTKYTSADALDACSQARRPQDLATCVVGISKSSQEAANPAVLTYCGRSLLPETFAKCVVGLRKAISNLPTNQALDTCIDGSDRASGIGATSTTPSNFSPTTPNSK